MSKVQAGSHNGVIANGVMPLEFGVRVERDSVAAVVAVSGEVDMAVAGELEAALARGAEQSTRVLLDLSECTFLDSTGLRAILLASRSIEGGRDGGFAIAAPTSQVARILKISGVHDIVPIFASREEAREALPNKTSVD